MELDKLSSRPSAPELVEGEIKPSFAATSTGFVVRWGLRGPIYLGARVHERWTLMSRVCGIVRVNVVLKDL